jgi:hypothetical protein
MLFSAFRSALVALIVTHHTLLQVSSACNFTTSGNGIYTFAAVNRFHYVGLQTGSSVELHAERVAARSTIIDSKLAAPRSSMTKYVTYTGCLRRLALCRKRVSVSFDINLLPARSKLQANTLRAAIPPILASPLGSKHSQTRIMTPSKHISLT